MVLAGARSWNCDKQGELTLDGEPITRAQLGALLKECSVIDARLDAAVQKVKEAILSDRRAGLLPAVRSYSALHDHVDANDYLQLVAKPHEVDFCNAVMDRVNEWLEEGGLSRRVDPRGNRRGLLRVSDYVTQVQIALARALTGAEYARVRRWRLEHVLPSEAVRRIQGDL
jgi:hypothetical protein